jgi:ATP-dependent DNA helicase MPH1
MRSLKPNQKWAYVPLAKVSSLARAMGYLVSCALGFGCQLHIPFLQIEASMEMCHTYLQELSHPKGDGEGARKAQRLLVDPKFKTLMTEIERQRTRGFSLHPKMDMLKGLILQHFADRSAEEGADGENETRAMVFVTYRECVDQIVDLLNAERPMIRASKFIGQGTDKQGKKGFAQKEQLEARLLSTSTLLIFLIGLHR